MWRAFPAIGGVLLPFLGLRTHVLQYPIWRELAHTLEMPERALALEAGAADER